MNSDVLVGKTIEAMEVDKYPPSSPITGIVQSSYGNGTAIIVTQYGVIVHVRIQGAKVVER